MAKPVRLTPKKDGNSWRLSVPPKLSLTGKRQNLLYRTQALALAAAKDLKAKREDFGNQARAIGPSLAERATAAESLLRPYGIDVLEAARIVATMREKEAASKLLKEAAAAWLLACDGLRPRTVKNYKLTVGKLVTALGDRLLATISAKELQDVVAPAGCVVSTAAERTRNTKVLWRWCAKKGWCLAETFAQVEMPKINGESNEIQILSTELVERLLRTAENHFPQAVASYALQLFAGIRVEELERMDAELVTDDGIELPGRVTKMGRRRHITPNDTLAAWLKRYPFTPCANWIETSAACRRIAGWNVASVILKNRLIAGKMDPLPKPSLGRWPQNAMRHSHASYAVASGVPIDSLLFEFGHTSNTATLRKHYVGRASKKQAAEFFEILPKLVGVDQKLVIA